MTRVKHVQPRKEPETVVSATDPIGMYISHISEIDFRVAILKSIATLEKKN